MVCTSIQLYVTCVQPSTGHVPEKVGGSGLALAQSVPSKPTPAQFRNAMWSRNEFSFPSSQTPSP